MPKRQVKKTTLAQEVKPAPVYNAHGGNAAVVEDASTHGAYNVVLTLAGHKVTMGCVGKAHAEEIANALEDCSWFECEATE